LLKVQTETGLTGKMISNKYLRRSGGRWCLAWMCWEFWGVLLNQVFKHTSVLACYTEDVWWFKKLFNALISVKIC